MFLICFLVSWFGMTLGCVVNYGNRHFYFKIGTLPILLDKAVGLGAGLPLRDLTLFSEQEEG